MRGAKEGRSSTRVFAAKLNSTPTLRGVIWGRKWAPVRLAASLRAMTWR